MLRFVPAFEGFRLHRVHKRPVVEHYEGVASLRRFPVLHAIELTFKLPVLKFSGGSGDDYATIPDDASSPS